MVELKQLCASHYDCNERACAAMSQIEQQDKKKVGLPVGTDQTPTAKPVATKSPNRLQRFFKRLHFFAPDGWLHKTLEVARLQSAITDKKRWIDEMYRQLGERIDLSDALPEDDELRSWRQSVFAARRDVAFMRQRIAEIDNPNITDYIHTDTISGLVSGGAVAGISDRNRRLDEANPATNKINADAAVSGVTGTLSVTGDADATVVKASSPSRSSYIELNSAEKDPSNEFSDEK